MRPRGPSWAAIPYCRFWFGPRSVGNNVRALNREKRVGPYRARCDTRRGDRLSRGARRDAEIAKTIELRSIAIGVGERLNRGHATSIIDIRWEI